MWVRLPPLIALPPGRTYHGRGWGPANHRAPRGPAGGEDTSAACRQPQRNGERKIFRFPVVKIRSGNRLASMSLNSRLPARSPPGLNQSTGAAGANVAGGRDGVELMFAVRGRAAWPQVCRPAGAGPVLVPSRSSSRSSAPVRGEDTGWRCPRDMSAATCAGAVGWGPRTWWAFGLGPNARIFGSVRVVRMHECTTERVECSECQIRWHGTAAADRRK